MIKEDFGPLLERNFMILSKHGFSIDGSPKGSEEKNRKFFNELYLKILKDVALTDLSKEYHLGIPVTRLFNLMEDYQNDKTINFFENQKNLAPGTNYIFSMELHHKPKTGLQDPLLFLELETHCIRGGVYFNIEKTNFYIYLKDFHG